MHDEDDTPTLPPEVLESLGDGDHMNLYATITPKGFSVRTIDRNLVVVSHDGHMMRFHDQDGEVLASMGHEEESGDPSDNDIDLLMNLAWGEGFAENLHTVLEGFMLAMGPMVDAMIGMDEGDTEDGD